MENHRLFIVLDHQGVNLFHNLITQLTQIQSTPDTEDLSENTPSNKDDWVSVLTYPSFFDSLDIEELPNIFLEWINKYFDGFDQQLLNTLTAIKNNLTPLENADVDDAERDHMSTCIHELADSLCMGSTLLEVYVFGAKEQFAKTNFPILSALKRLEICYPAKFVIVNDESLPRIVWTNFIDFDVLTNDEAFRHLQCLPLWAGTLNMKIQQSNADIPLQYYFLYADHDLSKVKHPTLFSPAPESTPKKKKAFDSKIQLITMVETQELPLHLVHFCRFTLRTLSARTAKEGFNLFSACQMKDKLFIGVLRYDDAASKGEYTARDWEAHVGDPFTHYLNALYTERSFSKHRALLLQYDEQQGAIRLYFFLRPDEINTAGLVKHLKHENVYFNCNDATADEDSAVEDSADEAMKFYKHGADIIHPWEWCEKNAWHEEENTSKVVKSISRLKSDELFMQGVMIPGIEPLNSNNSNNNSNNDNSEHDLIDTVLSMFDEKGMPVRSPLKDIPIIEDRLLKSVKCEDSINKLPYEEASKVIGHGLDYCTDSLNMLHLSDRLTKVQKRFIPKDTMNMMTGDLTKKEEESIAAVKKAAAAATKPTGRSSANSSKGPKSAAAGQKKESRAAKTKRRLRTICEGTVVKYGDVEQKHKRYEACVDLLFSKCLALCKELTTSKDLNNLMKKFAKDHVKDVVMEVLKDQETCC